MLLESISSFIRFCQVFWTLSYFPESLSIAAQSLVARNVKAKPKVCLPSLCYDVLGSLRYKGFSLHFVILATVSSFIKKLIIPV